MIQTVVVILTVALAVAYAVWRAWQAMANADNPCAGCEGCTLKKELRKARRKKGCADFKKKISSKTFGSYK